MSEPRFQVATCEGFRTMKGRTGWRKGTAEPGLSATVCDSLILYREIKTYRSEDPVTRGGERTIRGKAGAVRDTSDHADYLNSLYGDD